MADDMLEKLIYAICGAGPAAGIRVCSFNLASVSIFDAGACFDTCSFSPDSILNTIFVNLRLSLVSK